MMKIKMKKGDKEIGVWGLIVILIVVVSAFSWAAGSEEAGAYKIHAYVEQNDSNVKKVCNVTLITGDIIIVSTLPDGRRGFAIKPADSTKLGQNFQIIETPKGTYIFPEGIDLSKVDKELFNIDYLIREEYCNLTYMPVLVDYKDEEEKIFGVAEQKELEKEVNITIVKSYRSIPTFSAKLSFEGINETFKTLVERPEIKKIWLDKKVHASLYDSVPLIGAPELWNSGYNGSGLEIAILDTGVDDTHPDLDDLDDNPATYDPKVISKVDFTDDDTTEDLYGHGTHCAGIAAGTGVAPSEPYPTPTPVTTPTVTPTPPSSSEFSMHLRTGENFQEQKVKRAVYSSEATSPDAYEPDDNYWLANGIPTNGTKQLHHFHVPGDLDYVKFNATESTRYLIETSDLGYESDTYLYLYNTDGLTEITHDDDSGEGLASRIIWQCDTSGTYYVKVRHYSSSASGLNTHYNVSVLEGYTLPAEFNDVYSDYGLNTTTEDNLYDYLVIDVGVNVTKAGRYEVSGDLYENGTYNYVGYDSNTTDLNEGNQTIQLRFEGIRLRQNEYNGTYDLKYLELENATYPYPVPPGGGGGAPPSPDSERELEEQKIESGEISLENVPAMYGVQLDYRYYACTTLYYNWTEFQRPPAEFTGNFNDYGEDTNEDALYDFLVIEVGVNVTKAGRYRVRGELYENGTYNWVDYTTKFAYLSEGNQTIKLKFSGIDILENGYNGTYDLKYPGLYSEWKEQGYKYWKQIDYRYYAYTTAHYNYTDFQEFPRYIGVAPGAYLWNVKVLNQYGWGYESGIIDGIEYAAYGSDGIAHTGDEADIISMSLGGAPTDGTDPLSQAVNDAVDQGLVVAVAAGNDYDYFTVSTPGAAEKVITVGASDKKDDLAYFSSKGPTLDLRVKPDVVAPGVDIIAPRANNTTMGYPYNDYYTEASGTSMATPHVAGAAALILQVHPDWTPEEVKSVLISTADDLGYNVYQQGGGRIYVPSAANPKILVDPATISFKNLDTTSETITFKNLGTITHTLTLDVTVREVFDDTEVDCAYLNRTSLSIAPGSSASVLLTINDTSLPHSLYSGKVSATYSGGEVHAIFGFSNLNKVTVNKINMEGESAVDELVAIFSDTEDAWVQDGWTDENGTVVFYISDGVYHVISGWGDIPNASAYTIAENISVEADTNITLDERDVFIVDFDINKPDQIMAERDEDVCYNGEYIGVCFGALHWYPTETKTYITPTTLFNGTFVHSYYPEGYYNATEPGLINAPEWHKLIFWQSGIAENITFVADYDTLSEITMDYKVALEPDLAAWAQHAFCPGRWGSWTYVWRMDAPQRRVEWMSPEPAFYYKWYEQYAEWWNETYPEWEYDIPEQKYPVGTKSYFAIGEHPFKSGAKIYVGTGYLRISDTISKDTFGNSFANKSCDISGNITVIKDEEVVIDHEDIWDYFSISTYFSGTPRFNVIIQGNSSPRLSTYTKTELNFTTDQTADYQPPAITIRAFDWSSPTTSVLTPAQMPTPTPPSGGGGGGGGRVPSALYNIILGGDVKVRMNVEDESNISDATLEYSLDNGSTWNPASITYKGVSGCNPISGGDRTVVDETYTLPIYSKVRIFMDDTENNDEIYYNYDFTLKKSDGSEYTKLGTSTSTLGDINDTLYYDEDNDGVLDFFKSIYIGAYTEDDDTLDVKVEGCNGTTWECLYGKKIRRYEADLGYMNNTFVSLRANAIDSEGNTISQTVIKGFYVSGLELIKVFDTGPGTYPSIFGTHNGTITPNQTINISKLYTYPCPGTGGHTESIELYENGIPIANGTWNGYVGDWHNITIHNVTTGAPYIMLLKDHEYNYTIRTGSYPQIIHAKSKDALAGAGTITCDKFIDANGKEYTDWIPAIRLWA